MGSLRLRGRIPQRGPRAGGRMGSFRIFDLRRWKLLGSRQLRGGLAVRKWEISSAARCRDPRAGPGRARRQAGRPGSKALTSAAAPRFHQIHDQMAWGSPRAGAKLLKTAAWSKLQAAWALAAVRS